MNDIYKRALELNPKHTYKKIDFVRKQTKDSDFDQITYEEYDTEDKLVRTFKVKDYIRLYPPFDRIVSFN